MKYIRWNNEKNKKLEADRGVCFEDIMLAIRKGEVINEYRHPNEDKYGHQRMFVVAVRGYAYLVPYVEGRDEIFLKTIIPCRKATKKYMVK